MQRVLSDAASRTQAVGGCAGDRADLHAVWLVRLRWGAFVVETAIILTTRELFWLDLPVAALLGLASLVAATNAVLEWRLRRRLPVSRAWLGWIVVFDTLQLTALLYVSGGTSNPFSVFYLVQIAVAGVALGSRWTWFLAVLGVSSYAALFLLPVSASGGASMHVASGLERHLQAMWIALTVSAALTAYFVTRLANAVANSEQEVAAMRDVAARHERLAALTTLAAGAAHQLGTPLATVAVAAGELERAMAVLPAAQAHPLVDDVRLIRTEVQRSKEILEGMAGDWGHAGEMPTTFTAGDVVTDAIGQLGCAERARVALTDRAGGMPLFLPRRALARAVLSLVRNALEAAPGPRAVAIDLEAEPRLRICVRDEGPGMTLAVLGRAGEPFFTTKEPGRGLGLGLFLARSLADHLDGRLVLDSGDAGTTVILELPRQVAPHDRPA